MVTSYIKDADGCIFTHVHLCTGWYVPYTPRLYHTHLRNVLFQLIMSLLVAIVIEQQFWLR